MVLSLFTPFLYKMLFDVKVEIREYTLLSMISVPPIVVFIYFLLYCSILTSPCTPSCAFTGTFLMWNVHWRNLLNMRKVR